MKKKLLIFLDHPIIVRHFIASGVFRALEDANDVVYVCLPDEHKRMKGADLSDIAPERLLRLDECLPRNRIWTRVFQIDLLSNRSDEQAEALYRHISQAIGPKAFFLYRLYALPFVWPLYRRFLLRQVAETPNAALDALLDREKPDVLLHPTVLAGAYVNDLVAAAAARGLPLVGIMNSWDNPSTKRTTVGHLDWLLVWGQQTWEHAVRFMKMAPERVVRFGAAQFDVYRQAPPRPRDVTRARYGASADTRIVLYAGSSKGVDEFRHLELLEEAIENGTLRDAAIVYRPHPWGNCGKDGHRIGARTWRHVRFEESSMAYIETAKGGTQPITTPDYRNTHNILAAVEIVVSPLSTILLEAALNGLPSICLLDDDANDFADNSRRMVHFREFFEMPEFSIVPGENELVARINAAMDSLADPTLPARMRQAASYFVSPFDAPYGERLRDFIAHLPAA